GLDRRRAQPLELAPHKPRGTTSSGQTPGHRFLSSNSPTPAAPQGRHVFHRGGSRMQRVAERSPSTQGHHHSAGAADIESRPASSSTWADYKVIRRNGSVVGFEPSKISIAVTKAFLAVNGGHGAASARVRELVEQLTAGVVSALTRGKAGGATFHIEDIQDHVELALMRSGEHEVARAYVLYRERRAQERAAQARARADDSAQPVLHVVDGDKRMPLDMAA